MKVLLLADKESNYIWDHFDRDRFNDIEMIISCGDLKADYLSYLVTLIKAPLFYVHGNHNDNYKIHPPEGCTCIDGKLINYKGIRLLGLGGSLRYNTGEHQYTQKQMNRRILKLSPSLFWNKGFDILVSHAPAYGLCDGTDLCHTGFQSFIKVLDKYQPKYFFHGHQHLNYGLIPRKSQYNNTTIINAYEYHIIDIQVAKHSTHFGHKYL